MRHIPKTKQQLIDEINNLQRCMAEVESKATLELIMDKIPVLLAYVGADQHYIHVNQAYADWYGLSKKDITGKNVKEILSEESYKGAKRYIQTVLQGKEIVFENITYDHERKIRTVKASYIPHFDDHGEVKAFLAMVEDITERKIAEEVLHESEERFKGLFEQSPFSIQILDANGWTLQVNKGWERLWNSTPDMLADYNMLQDPQLEESGTLEYLKKAFSGEAVRIPPIEYSVEKQAGKGPTRWAQARAFPVKDDLGNVREVIVMHEDFTEQRRAEEALKESEKKFRTFTESAPVAIMIYRDSCCVYANPEVERITGYTIQELEQMKFADFVHPDNKDMIIELGKELDRGDSHPHKADFKIITKNGDEKWLDGRVEMIDYAGKRAALISAMDITERKKAEKLIRQSLEEKEILLKEVHHRVKNNLQVIISLLNLQAGQVQDSKMIQAFKESNRRIRTMALVHEKLYQSESYSTMNFKEYVEEMVQELISAYKVTGKVKLTLKIEDVPLGVSEAIPCGLILNELVSNTLKYAFPDSQEGQIQIAFRKKNSSGYELSVKDNGVGIPQAIDFNTTRSLGLLLVKILTNQMNGTVALSRKAGTGFTIRFKTQS